MNLAYLHYKIEEDNYRAGVLVTDEKTKPLEFRITTSLNIDQLQKILYGESLKEILFKERFGIELLNALKESYDLVLIKDKSLLILREKINKPVVFIQKYDEFLPKSRLSYKIINLQEKFEPLYITVSKEDENKLISIAKAFQEIYKYFNLLEPFDRIEKAIEFISLQEKL